MENLLTESWLLKITSFETSKYIRTASQVLPIFSHIMWQSNNRRSTNKQADEPMVKRNFFSHSVAH